MKEKARGKEPSQKSPEVISFGSPGFEKGKKDYQTLAAGNEVKPGLVLKGKEYELYWKSSYRGSSSSLLYLETYRSLLGNIGQKEVGQEAFVYTKSQEGLRQPLPVHEKDVKDQLFGFGWAALQAGDLKTAYPTLRLAGALRVPSVFSELSRLAVEDDKARGFFLSRQRHEKGLITRPASAQAHHRAEQALTTLKEILKPVSL